MRIQAQDETIACVNIDAVNAFNSMSQQLVFNELLKINPLYANWFCFQYKNTTCVTFNEDYKLEMETGFAQGLATSNTNYCIGKWKLKKK